MKLAASRKALIGLSTSHRRAILSRPPCSERHIPALPLSGSSKGHDDELIRSTQPLLEANMDLPIQGPSRFAPMAGVLFVEIGSPPLNLIGARLSADSRPSEARSMRGPPNR